jgi:hypothetical protein
MTTSVGRGFLSTAAPVRLTPCKLASIIELTREMMESSNAENIITRALIDSAAPGVDGVLLCPPR